MKRFCKVVRWKCFNYGGGLSRYPEMLGEQRTIELFWGWLLIDRHFKGCEIWSVEWTLFGTPWVNFKPITDLGKCVRWQFDFTLRIGSPIITIRRPFADRYSGVNVIA